MTLRIQSPLPPETETLVERTIDALLAVHRELGSGFTEAIYAAAVRVELTDRLIAFESEKRIMLRYRDQPLGCQQLDLLIDQKVVVEIKSVDALHPVHVSQVVSYLRASGARVGLLVNFNVPVLKQGLRRVIR